MTLESIRFADLEQQFTETHQEKLSRERLELQRQLATVSALLCAVNSAHTELIGKIIVKNGEIRDSGFDTSSLVADLEPNPAFSQSLLARLKNLIDEETTGFPGTEPACR